MADKVSRTAGSPKKQCFFRVPFLKSLFPFEETGFFCLGDLNTSLSFQLLTHEKGKPSERVGRKAAGPNP